MEFRISPEDRRRFKRCRRQWDFASPHRRGLEPADPPETGAVAAAVKDALSVYYYPGTWDWQHDLKQSLVQKAMHRSLTDAHALGELAHGDAIIDSYDAWAATVDDFAPVKIAHDVTALVRDPADPERGLATADGSGVSYTCRVDLVAVDAMDEYWVVRHSVCGDWCSVTELLFDEEAVAACWAWEQDYIGMQMAGTIHNEIRIDGTLDAPAAVTGPVASVAQHGPSGGGRSIPQHVRLAARDSRPVEGDRIEQRTAGLMRRTRIRRSREEIAAAGDLIATEAIVMTGAPVVYPNPGPHCLDCEFSTPCLAMFEGADPGPLLAAGFKRRSDAPRTPRLGQATWGFGRGAAPPNW